MPKITNPNVGRRMAPLTKAEIVHAQKHTKSNMEAARFIGTGYLRYRRYAKIYNLWDSHLNQKGFGTNKGYAARASTTPLKDVFANKHPGYSLIRLKNRMIARGLLLEECSMCGFKEKRITDSKTPLLITFKNGMKDFTQDNIHLLCYNCLFLTTGSPTVAHRGYIAKSFEDPDAIPKKWQVNHRPADALDPQEDHPDNNETPSSGQEDEFSDIRKEVMRELGRD